MRYVELFAGAGGLSRGLEAAGMTCVAHAEIEPHARAVLRAHWPDVPLLGDVVTAEWAPLAGRVDLVAGGSPCQDLSRGGKMAGLAGARSGLFHELVRAWRATDATYCLWENVYGALSSNSGADFAAVLSAFVGAAVDVPEKWRSRGVAAGPHAVAAWRVCDVQDIGLPHRRRRVFVLVARSGGCDPAEVLDVAAPDGERDPARLDRLGPWWNGAHIVPSLDVSGIVKQQTMPEKGRLWAVRGTHTVPVAFEPRDEDDPCTQCGGNYGECPCPGPTQDALTYVEVDGVLCARLPWLRRLTPRECERLMGWPDDWTREGINDKRARYLVPDTARFRLCGNGVATPVAARIADRLLDAHRAVAHT